jgi:hypothetical protein
VDASADPARARAYLAASDARAADAVPYGPPEGATGRVAYVLSLDVPTAPSSTGLAWLAVLVIAVAALVALAARKLRDAGASSG